jgi:TatD DNase family protein
MMTSGPLAVIDSHCHLDFPDYGDELPQVLARARAAGVVGMICIGAGRDIGSARGAVALAAREGDVFASVGIHPHDVAMMTEDTWRELDDLARASRVVGIGETGLDFYYDHSPRDQQRAAFRRFIALARACKRPVICHIRDAHEEAAEILAAENAGHVDVGGVIHCFSGGPADARRYLALGFHLSLSGILTFKNAGPIREAAAEAPLTSLLVETDAPFLAPVPHRGKRNEPAYILQTLARLAEVRGIPVEEVAAATADNARRLFRLDSCARPGG